MAAPTEASPASAPARPDARFLGTAIVLTTLLAAIVGYLLNHASTQSDRSNDHAQQFGLEASTELPQARQKAEADYFNYVLRQSELRESGAAFWESIFADAGDLRWADLQSVYEDLADKTGKSIPTDLGPDSPFGPAKDAGFPNAFFTVRTAQATKLTALQDGENEIGSEWSKLTSEYSAVLTIYAVALFLLGTALALYGFSRIMFSSLGIALVVVGTAWSIDAARTPPGKVSEPAADAFTLGEHYVATALSKGDYDKAIAAYTEAINDRPTFARAYNGRAVAEARRGSQLIGGGFLSNVEDEWLVKEIADEQKAYDLGLNEVNVLNSLGFDKYVQWLRHGSGRPPSEAVDLFRQVVIRDPEDPVPWLNLGLILLADGKTDEADTVYRTGLNHMLNSGVGADIPRGASAYGRQLGWFAGAMTDLDNLANGQAVKDKPEVQKAAKKMQVLLATAMATTGKAAPKNTVEIPADSVSFAITADGPQVTFDAPDGWNADTEKSLLDEAVTIVWYERTAVKSGPANAWNGISDITNWGQGEDHSPYNQLRWDASDSTYFDNEHFLQNARECLPTAEYKVEIYIDGGLVVSKEADDVDTAGLVAAFEADMGAGFCRPADWVNVFGAPGSDPTTDELSGIVFGYESPDGTSGAYLLRMYPHQDQFFNPPDGDLQTLTANVMDSAVGILRGDALAQDIALDHDDRGGYFMALDQTDRAIYLSPTSDTGAIVGGGQTDDKAIIVAIVFGPKSEIDDSDDTTSTLEKVYSSVSPV